MHGLNISMTSSSLEVETKYFFCWMKRGMIWIMRLSHVQLSCPPNPGETIIHCLPIVVYRLERQGKVDKIASSVKQGYILTDNSWPNIKIGMFKHLFLCLWLCLWLITVYNGLLYIFFHGQSHINFTCTQVILLDYMLCFHL